jgi:CheY-like chemotaxis protein
MAYPDTILIVDDDSDTLEAMRLMLESEGYLVATATDGREALTVLVKGLRPCVIVMDLSMPVMDGVEFRKEQLNHPDIAGIPFIAYSAVLDARSCAQDLRASGYLEKPTEFQHVLSIIRQHCNH